MIFLDYLLRTLGVILGLLATGFGIIKVWREARAASSAASVSSLQAAADEWKELKDDYRTRLKDAEERMKETESRLDALEQERKDLRRDVDALREAEGMLVRWLRVVRAGVEQGTIPPWPVPPEWLTALDERYPTV